MPDDFLASSRLAALFPHVVRLGELLRNGKPARESWIEFSDIHDGKYPDDAFTEAIVLLRQHREEFLRLSDAPGVVARSLAIFGDAETCAMEMEPADIALMNELSLHVAITPYAHGSAFAQPVWA